MILAVWYLLLAKNERAIRDTEHAPDFVRVLPPLPHEEQ